VESVHGTLDGARATLREVVDDSIRRWGPPKEDEVCRVNEDELYAVINDDLFTVGEYEVKP